MFSRVLRLDLAGSLFAVRSVAAPGDVAPVDPRRLENLEVQQRDEQVRAPPEFLNLIFGKTILAASKQFRHVFARPLRK